MNAPIWVTGLGLVTPLGAGVEATWAALVRGDRAIAPVTLFDVSGQRVAIAAEVREVTPSRGSASALGLWSRTGGMALAAAEEAMRAARLDARTARVGLVVGTTTGGMFETERLLAEFCAKPTAREERSEMRRHPLTAIGDHINEVVGPFARVRTLSSACSSGANAIVVAAAWLRSGEVDVVVAGGADSLCCLTLSGFNALGAIDPEPCRPFHRRRRGTSLGEGAGFLVLEHAEQARRRRVEPVAELAGWALGSEAHHITNPAPDGAFAAGLISRALGRAGLSPKDVDYVSAHGTGTAHNDAMEAAAIARALGAEVKRVPVSSSKAQMGHTLGASGAIEAAVSALVVYRRTLVPTAGLDEPDPALDLVHVPHVGRTVARVRAALSNAFGFGGMDTVLVFSEPSSIKRGSVPRATRAAGACGLRTCVITGAAIFGPGGRLGAGGCAQACGAAEVRGGPVDPDGYLDATRARRLDRPARIGAVAVAHALAEAGVDAQDAGLVLGSAFGNVDASATFLHRVFDRGPRSASPAEFPNLVPSSPVGHISIYAGMHGPAFATADLSASGESAFVQAVQLVASSESACVVAGAIDLASDIVDRVLGPLFAHGAQAAPPRTDLAAALVVEAEADARGRSAPALARIVQALEWRGDSTASIRALVAPHSDRSEVVLPRPNPAVDEILRPTRWGACPRLLCAPVFGQGDALGAVALVVAAARVAADCTREVLVLGLSLDRGYAVVLAAP